MKLKLILSQLFCLPPDEHTYAHFPDLPNSETCARTVPLDKENLLRSQASTISGLQKKILEYEAKVKDLDGERLKLLTENKKLKKCRLSVEDLKNSDELTKLYTGLPNYKTFEWLSDRLREKAGKLHYYRGLSSFKAKKHQSNVSHRKPGKAWALTTDNELLLTLKKIRTGCSEEDLAFQFGVPQSVVSQILNTWIPFLALELECLVVLPTKEQVSCYYPRCFKDHPDKVSIIDCTERPIERPSLAKAQCQTYSSYKSRNTWKKLIGITPAGTIRFVSNSYGGSASDRFIVENSGFLDKLNQGDVAMADKGFKISDLISKGCRLSIPPFLKDKGRFTEDKADITASIAKARIDVEQAIARIKDF